MGCGTGKEMVTSPDAPEKDVNRKASTEALIDRSQPNQQQPQLREQPPVPIHINGGRSEPAQAPALVVTLPQELNNLITVQEERSQLSPTASKTAPETGVPQQSQLQQQQQQAQIAPQQHQPHQPQPPIENANGTYENAERPRKKKKKRSKKDTPATIYDFFTAVIGGSRTDDSLRSMLRTTNLSETDGRGMSALSMAARYGKQTLVQELLSQNQTSVFLQDDDGQSALHKAAYFGHAANVALLIKHVQTHQPDQVQDFVEAPDKWGNTALHLAVFMGEFGAVSVLLRAGARVDGVRNDEGCVPSEVLGESDPDARATFQKVIECVCATQNPQCSCGFCIIAS